MNVPDVLRDARGRAGVTQAALAKAVGTSQATVSAYESGRKQPSVETLDRLLSATGARLAVAHGHAPLTVPSPRRHAQSGRAFADVLMLAEALPTRHAPVLSFPRLSPAPREK